MDVALTPITISGPQTDSLTIAGYSRTFVFAICNLFNYVYNIVFFARLVTLKIVNSFIQMSMNSTSSCARFSIGPSVALPLAIHSRILCIASRERAISVMSNL